MPSLASVRRDWLSNPRADILAGIVVALALIPEAIGFSVIAGVDPRVGLYASFSIAVIIAFTGGRPGMISAATASVAVVIIPLVRDYGVDYLFAATVLMGFFQVVASLLRLDLLMQYVSRSVVTGFVNALAILIFMAQLPQLLHVRAGHLSSGRGRPRHHLPVPAADEGDPVPARRDRRPDVRHRLWGHPRQHGGRHGTTADIAAGPCAFPMSRSRSIPSGSSSPIR